jgi:precorrin-6B methylase 2
MIILLKVVSNSFSLFIHLIYILVFQCKSAYTDSSRANVLDFGAGSGSYSIPAAQLVGPTGEVYAADIHPLALKEIRKKAEMKGIKNLRTILTACETELPDSKCH